MNPASAERLRGQCKLHSDERRRDYLDRLRNQPLERDNNWDESLYDFLSWDEVRQQAMSPTGRVLVLGDNDLAGLAIVRSLGWAGLQVHLVKFDGRPVTRHSRYIHQAYDLGHPIRDTDRYRTGDLELVGGGFDLVIPSNDIAMLPLLAVREDIHRQSRFAAPDPVGFEATNDKARTIEIARRLGVAVPETLIVATADDIERAKSLRGFPLALKPSRSVTPDCFAKNTVRIAESPDELAQSLPEMVGRGPVLVQEFCPGFGVGLSALAREGELVAAFQHRRIHEPPRGGASSYRASMPLDDALLEAVRKMCREIQWTGPAMFEFKCNPLTNESVLMEINGRFWGSLALAIQSGVDFPRLLYELLVLGRVTETFSYRVPRYTRYTPQELYWLQANLCAPAGRADFLKIGWRELLGEFGNIIRLREGYDIESITDPLPAVASWVQLAKDVSIDVHEKLSLRQCRGRLRRLRQRIRARHPAISRRIREARSILFLCHGNINRSAVAEARMKYWLGNGLAHVIVSSSGFIAPANRQTSSLSQEVARGLGIDLSAHRSSVVDQNLLDDADLIVVMDADNVRRLCGFSPAAGHKMVPLAAFDDGGDSVEIEDPYGQSLHTFEQTYHRIIKCVDALAGWVRAGHSR